MILTQKTTKILGFIASIIAIVIGFMLVVMPAFNTWTENNEAISQAEGEVSLMQSQRDGFLQAQTMFPQLEEIDNDLRVRFPEIADNDGIITQISAALLASGIQSSDLTLSFSAPEIMTPTFAEPPPAPAEEAPAEEAPAEEVPAEAPPADPAAAAGPVSDMAKMSVSISVKGTDEQIVEFLNVLHSADRAIIVKQFSVTRSSETGLNELAVTTEVYIFSRIPNPAAVNEMPEGQEEYVSDDITGEATA